MSRKLCAVLVISVSIASPVVASAESLKLEGSWKSSLGPWKGGARMNITSLAGSKLSGTSQSTDGLCVGEHPIQGTLQNGKWKLITRPGGMCKEMRIELTRNGDSWSGSYELIGPTPDKGTNSFTAVK